MLFSSFAWNIYIYITHSDRKLAGYYFLHAHFPHAVDSTSSTLAPLPCFSEPVDPVPFAVALILYLLPR